MPDLPDREVELVNVARDIRRYWKDSQFGYASPNAVVFLARSLERVLALYGDIPPVHDADREEWANELDRR